MAYKTRFSRRKSAIYRTGRRYGKRFVSKKVRSARIFRKFLRRTAIKPELKWLDSNALESVTAETSRTFVCTPTAINPGTSGNQRVGNRINIIKVDVRALYKNDSSILGSFAPIRACFLYRAIIWTPRVDYASALAAMNAVQFNQNIDIHCATIYRDHVGYLYPPFMEEGVADAVPSGNGRDIVYKKYSIKFPRKVNFLPSQVSLDEEKAQLFLTVKTQGALSVQINTRTWWYDA